MLIRSKGNKEISEGYVHENNNEYYNEDKGDMKVQLITLMILIVSIMSMIMMLMLIIKEHMTPTMIPSIQEFKGLSLHWISGGKQGQPRHCTRPPYTAFYRALQGLKKTFERTFQQSLEKSPTLNNLLFKKLQPKCCS